MTGWVVRDLVGTAASAHGTPLPPGPLHRRLWHVHTTDRAIVLGSAQPDEGIDRDRARALGLDVVRRRSGGGAVLVEPGDLTWVDVVIPRGDPLWHDDVGRSFLWLGRIWAEVVRALGGVDVDVHTGAMRRSPASHAVCFAGLGPGEVTMGGAKVVGLSQRRTRHGARFQCALLHRWRPEPLLEVLRVGALADAAVADEVRGCARGIGTAEATLPLLLDALP